MKITSLKFKNIIRESVKEAIEEGLFDRTLQAGKQIARNVAGNVARNVERKVSSLETYAQKGVLPAEVQKLKAAINNFRTAANKIIPSGSPDVEDFVLDLEDSLKELQ